jgi:hypothetical protein
VETFDYGKSFFFCRINPTTSQNNQTEKKWCLQIEGSPFSDRGQTTNAAAYRLPSIRKLQ